jgi:ABC-type sugar transport system ATPase subunit
VRPEHVRIEKSRAGHSQIDAVVRLVEMLGDSTIATLEVGRTTWDSGAGHIGHNSDVFYVLSKIEPRSDLQPGDRVAMRVEASGVHLFDAETGENWVRRAAPA